SGEQRVREARARSPLHQAVRMAVPAVLLIAVAAAAPVGVPADPPPPVTTWTVDSGTTGALVEDHRAPTVVLRVEFPSGTWSPWGRTHHAEEAFEFQDDDPGRSLKRRADALGAHLSLDVV